MCWMHYALKPDSQQLDSDFAKLPQTPAILAVESAEISSSTLLEIIPEHVGHGSPGEVHPASLRRHQPAHC